MSNKIRVSILDDHQSIVDGYIHRLIENPKIRVGAAMSYAEELESSLAAHPTDVLLLDINVPTALDNPNPYPILYTIPKLLDPSPYINSNPGNKVIRKSHNFIRIQFPD